MCKKKKWILAVDYYFAYPDLVVELNIQNLELTLYFVDLIIEYFTCNWPYDSLILFVQFL